MPSDSDHYQAEGRITEGEARALVACITDVLPDEVTSWLIIAHVHPANAECHEARAVTNAPLLALPRLISEGLEAL